MTPDQFKGIRFVEIASRIKAKRVEDKLPKNVKYLTAYNDYQTVRDFVKEIKAQFNAFKFDLLLLPLSYPIPGNRQAFVNHLHEQFVVIHNRLLAYAEVLKLDFAYTSNIPGLTEMDIFPRVQSKDTHPTERDYENHKVHYMHFYHRYIVIRAIEEVELYCQTEGFAYKSNGLNGSAKSNPAEAHFKTDLSVEQVAFLFQILTDVICTGVNKTELAKFLSQVFSTSRVSNPSYIQMKKAFYDVDEHTQQAVKDVILDMLKKVQHKRR